MLIYLYGQDSYRRNEKVRKLVEQYKSKYKEIDFLVVDLDENPDNWVRVGDFLNQPSMFVNSKLVVIKESSAVSEANGFSKSDIRKWLGILKNYVKTEKISIIISDKELPRKDCEFLLKETFKTQEFELLTGRKLELFLQIEAKKRGLAFEERAWRFFTDYILSFNDRCWVAVQELERIYLAQFAKPISLKDLNTIIFWSKYAANFDLVRGLLSSYSLGERLLKLEMLNLRGDEPRHIFNLLGSLVRNKNDVFALARYDECIKSGELDDETALLDFVLNKEIVLTSSS